MGEIMVGHKDLSLVDDFYYSDSKIFSRKNQVALRWLPQAELVEEKLLNQGFHLKLFRVHEDLNFVIDHAKRDFAFRSEPQTLRFICTK